MSNLITVSGKETDPKKIAFAIQQLSSLVAKAADTLQIANNLSDVSSVAAARINLGLGSAATHSATDFLAASSNLSDVASTTTARLNLGLGTAAVLNAGTSSNSVVQLDGSAKLPAVDGSALTGIAAPVLLTTITAAGTSALTMAGGSPAASFSSTYSRFLISVENLVPATNSVVCRMRLNNGTAVQTSSYLSATFIWTGAGVAEAAESTYIPISRRDTLTLTSNSTNAGLSGQVMIYNTSNSTAVKLVQGECIHADTTNVLAGVGVRGYWNVATASITDFEISMTAGSVTTGVVKVYGMK